jgi:hypothetical protein
MRNRCLRKRLILAASQPKIKETALRFSAGIATKKVACAPDSSDCRLQSAISYRQEHRCIDAAALEKLQKIEAVQNEKTLGPRPRARGSSERLPEKDLKLKRYRARHHTRAVHFQQQCSIVVNHEVGESIALQRFAEHQRIPAAI